MVVKTTVIPISRVHPEADLASAPLLGCFIEPIRLAEHLTFDPLAASRTASYTTCAVCQTPPLQAVPVLAVALSLLRRLCPRTGVPSPPRRSLLPLPHTHTHTPEPGSRKLTRAFHPIHVHCLRHARPVLQCSKRLLHRGPTTEDEHVC